MKVQHSAGLADIGRDSFAMVDVHYDIDANSILDTSALGVLTNEGITYRKLSLATRCI